MKSGRVLFCIVVTVLGSLTVSAAIVGVMDFETHPSTATYGSPGLPPGSIAFTESGVPVMVSEFNLPGGGTSYNFARISVGATGQTLELNNVLLGLDFAHTHSAVSALSMEYMDMGGAENLQVNGGTMQVGGLDSFGANVAPGVELYVTKVAIPGGTRGKILLRGAIESVALGGQEFFIDNLRWDSCQ